MDAASEIAPSGQAARGIFPAKWGLAVPRLVTDSREQRPLDLDAWPGGTVTRKLDFGDYALDGFDSLDRPGIVFERKSIGDLVGSLTGDRERFTREIYGLKRFDFAALVIEADMRELEGACRQAHPASIVQSLFALQARHRIHVLWTGDRRGAADCIMALCRQWLRGLAKDVLRCPRAERGTA